MEISTWPVFFPVMDLQEPLSPAPLRQQEVVQAAVSLISSGGRSSSSSASPAPHADLHNAAAFIDCEEIVIHSHGSSSPSRCLHPHTLRGRAQGWSRRALTQLAGRGHLLSPPSVPCCSRRKASDPCDGAETDRACSLGQLTQPRRVGDTHEVPAWVTHPGDTCFLSLVDIHTAPCCWLPSSSASIPWFWKGAETLWAVSSKIREIAVFC